MYFRKLYKLKALRNILLFRVGVRLLLGPTRGLGSDLGGGAFL